MLKKVKLNGSVKIYKTFWNTPKYILFIIEDWNAKVGSQEIRGKTATLALEYRMKQDEG